MTREELSRRHHGIHAKCPVCTHFLRKDGSCRVCEDWAEEIAALKRSHQALKEGK